MLFGRERATAIVRFAEHCVHRAETLIAEQAIDCDYAATGNVMAVVHPKQEKRLRRAAEVAGTVGAAVSFLAADAMRTRGIPPAFLCGALEGAGGTLDPGKLVLGLRHAARAAGVLSTKASSRGGDRRSQAGGPHRPGPPPRRARRDGEQRVDP